jgi:hypothetical protein
VALGRGGLLRAAQRPAGAGHFTGESLEAVRQDFFSHVFLHPFSGGLSRSLPRKGSRRVARYFRAGRDLKKREPSRWDGRQEAAQALLAGPPHGLLQRQAPAVH